MRKHIQKTSTFNFVFFINYIIWHSITIALKLFLGNLPLNVSRTVECHVNQMTVPLIENHAIHHRKCSNSYPDPFYIKKIEKKSKMLNNTNFLVGMICFPYFIYFQQIISNFFYFNSLRLGISVFFRRVSRIQIDRLIRCKKHVRRCKCKNYRFI